MDLGVPSKIEKNLSFLQNTSTSMSLFLASHLWKIDRGKFPILSECFPLRAGHYKYRKLIKEYKFPLKFKMVTCLELG